MYLDLDHYTPAPDILKDRIILVTGASDGIGRVAAETLAAHGATVILSGRNQAKLEQAYDAIVEAGGPEPAMAPLDLSSAAPADYANLAGLFEQEFGRLDGLLHNAAVLGTLTPIDYFEPEVWQEVLQVNLTAPFLLTRACMPLLRRSEDASVLFTSCGVGRKAKAYWGAFAVSKFGLEGMMQVLADEVETATSIRVNSLDPGPLRTRMRVRAYPGEDPKSRPKPETVMPYYLYLLGPDGKEIRGQTLSSKF